MTPAPRVILRAFTAVDAGGLEALFADPQTRLWNPGSYDTQGASAWIAAANSDEPSGFTRAVADPDDDRLLGTVSLFAIDRSQHTADIGYRVLPAERRRGVAGAAVTAMCALGFVEHSLERIALFHAVNNPGSCAVARRAGFTLEGELRRSYRYGDGARHDEHLHARLSDDPPPSTIRD